MDELEDAGGGLPRHRGEKKLHLSLHHQDTSY